MRDIWYIKDNKRTKEINKKEIASPDFIPLRQFLLALSKIVLVREKPKQERRR